MTTPRSRFVNLTISYCQPYDFYCQPYAIEKAKSTDPEAIRAALLATKGLKGVEGTYNFDPNGDGVHGYNVVRNVNGKVSFIKHIEFDQ